MEGTTDESKTIYREGAKGAKESKAIDADKNR
jgi:hypothetical protein